MFLPAILSQIWIIFTLFGPVRHTESDVYEHTVQLSQVGSKTMSPHVNFSAKAEKKIFLSPVSNEFFILGSDGRKKFFFFFYFREKTA